MLPSLQRPRHGSWLAPTARILLCLALSPVSLAGASDEPATASSSGPWIERSRYAMPFEDRAGWLDFMSRDGAVDTSPLAAAYPEREFNAFLDGSLASVDRVAFRSGDLVLRGILVRPAGDGPFPAVVYARGGNREWGQLRFLDVVRMLAISRHGFVVLAPEYRGEGGSDGVPELGAGDVDDLLAATAALDAWDDADTTRLGLIGLSRGGLVAAWALARSDRFDAAVLIAPSLDLEASATRRPELDAAVYAKSVAGYTEDRLAALRRASPLHAVDQMATTPLLLLHGAADRRVHPSVSLDFSRHLLDRDHRHRLLVLEDGDHSLSRHAERVRREIDAWLASIAAEPEPSTGQP